MNISTTKIQFTRSDYPYKTNRWVVCVYSRKFLPLTEAFGQPSRTSAIDLFCENTQQLNAVNYFYKKHCRRCFTEFYAPLLKTNKYYLS